MTDILEKVKIILGKLDKDNYSDKEESENVDTKDIKVN